MADVRPYELLMTFSLRRILFSACACACGGVAVAQNPSLQIFIFEPSLQPPEGVLLWDDMNAKQRAELWPLLSNEQRLVKWRHMSREERNQMRRYMSPIERNDLKRRFVIDRLPEKASSSLKARSMTPAERELLRRQVIEVHVEMRSGVPYDCFDPTDCRRPRTKSASPDKNHSNATGIVLPAAN